MIFSRSIFFQFKKKKKKKKCKKKFLVLTVIYSSNLCCQLSERPIKWFHCSESFATSRRMLRVNSRFCSSFDKYRESLSIAVCFVYYFDASVEVHLNIIWTFDWLIVVIYVFWCWCCCIKKKNKKKQENFYKVCDWKMCQINNFIWISIFTSIQNIIICKVRKKENLSIFMMFC